ncbi:unnamed protein product, partial [Durusdinium trenchii]
MKLSQRFELLMHERRSKAGSENISDQDLLSEIIERFNDFKSNAALKRWQITPDQTAAIQGIVLGMTEDSRNLVRSHLDFEKYEESGRAAQEHGRKLLTVSEGSQYLAFKVYNYWWSLHAKKVKRTMRSRLRWQEEQWNRNVDRCCLAEWLITEAREDSKAPWDYNTDLDAVLIGRPNKITCEQFAMWQDHVSKAVMKDATGPCDGLEMTTEVEDAVIHLRDQIEIGLRASEQLMEKRCLMVCANDKSHAVGTLKRRVMADASTKFEADIQKLHHIGFIDLSKFGRLTVPIIDEVVLDMMVELNDACYLASYSETTNNAIFSFATTQVKDKLLEVCFISTWEDWKAARGLMSAVTPKFVADADLSELTNPKMPQLKVCTMTAAGHLQLPDATRKKWLDDPVRSEVDLADPKAVAELPGNSDEAQPCETPPSLSAEEFKQKHPEVVLEEQTGQGPQDTQPMSLYDLITLLEKRNIVDFTITGHKVERPASVCRGEAKDTFQVTHDAYSVYKPNAVQLKAVKAGNLAGVIGTKSLSSSKYISMVWRIL